MTRRCRNLTRPGVPRRTSSCRQCPALHRPWDAEKQLATCGTATCSTRATAALAASLQVVASSRYLKQATSTVGPVSASSACERRFKFHVRVGLREHSRACMPVLNAFRTIQLEGFFPNLNSCRVWRPGACGHWTSPGPIKLSTFSQGVHTRWGPSREEILRGNRGVTS